MKSRHRKASFLRPGELTRLEHDRAGGIRSTEVVQLFAAKGAKLSSATFRKYVQLGLLPRSRRVGRKGKHKGSTGLYPVSVVRRIDLIKRMMQEGMTIEEIRGSFVAVKNQLDDVERGFSALLGELAQRARTHPQGRKMVTELGRAEREVRAALRRVERVGGTVATIPSDPERWTGWRAGDAAGKSGGQPAAT
jgi:DNA-binding transcriptional MerR regulator